MNYEYVFLSEGAELALKLKEKMKNKLSLNAMIVLIEIACLVEAYKSDTVNYFHIAPDWFKGDHNLDVVRDEIKNYLNLNDNYQLVMSIGEISANSLKKLGCDVKSGLIELRNGKLIEITKDDKIVLLFTNFHQNVLASMDLYFENLKNRDEYNVLIDKIEEITGLKKCRTQLKQILREKFYGNSHNQEHLVRILLENNYNNMTDGTRLNYIKKARSKISKNGEIYA